MEIAQGPLPGLWTPEILTLAFQAQTLRQRNTNTASASQSASSLPSNQLSASSSSQGLKIDEAFLCEAK